MPWVCLPHPLLVPIGLIDIVCLGPVFLIPGLPSFGWIRHSVPWACLILPGLTLSDLTVDFIGMYMRMGCLSEFVDSVPAQPHVTD